MTPPLAEALPETISPHTIWWISGLLAVAGIFLLLRKVWVELKSAIISDLEHRISEVEKRAADAERRVMDFENELRKVRETLTANADARSQKLIEAVLQLQDTIDRKKHGR